MLSRVSVASAFMATPVAPASWGQGSHLCCPFPSRVTCSDGWNAAEGGGEAGLAVFPESEGRAGEIVRGLEPEDPAELHPSASPTGTQRQEVCAPLKCQDVGSFVTQPWVIKLTGSVIYTLKES